MATTSPKNIVILGGSYGGISIAHHLLKHTFPQLPVDDLHQIILISSSTEVICRPACPRAMISSDMFPQDKLFVSITEQFQQYHSQNFRFIQGTAIKVDHTNQSVTFSLHNKIDDEASEEKLNFHALVIATGASSTSPLFGFTPNHDENFLRQSWAQFRNALPTARSIVIAGGGPTGIETAGELGEYLNGRPGWFSSTLNQPKVSITVVTSDSKILPVLRPEIAEKAEGFLTNVGVEIIKGVRVKGVEPSEVGLKDVGSKAKVLLDNGKTLEADIYIPATGSRANTGFLDQNLRTSDGRVDTNSSTLRVDRAGPRIYAVGDVASYSRPAIHLILDAIPVLGANMKRDLLLEAGIKETEVSKERNLVVDTRETHLIPIGKSKGVGALMGWKVPSWLVWAIKGRDYWLWTTGGLWSGKQWIKEG